MDALQKKLVFTPYNFKGTNFNEEKAKNLILLLIMQIKLIFMHTRPREALQ